MASKRKNPTKDSATTPKHARKEMVPAPPTRHSRCKAGETVEAEVKGDIDALARKMPIQLQANEDDSPERIYA
jgi:hypothetical protein